MRDTGHVRQQRKWHSWHSESMFSGFVAIGYVAMFAAVAAARLSLGNYNCITKSANPKAVNRSTVFCAWLRGSGSALRFKIYGCPS